MPVTRRRRQQQLEQMRIQSQNNSGQSQQNEQEHDTQPNPSTNKTRQTGVRKDTNGEQDGVLRPRTRNNKSGKDSNCDSVPEDRNHQEQRPCDSREGDVRMKTENKSKEELERLKTEKLNNECVQKNVLELLENHLCCAICQDVYINPVILNCSHSFCKYCLNAWLVVQDRCPSCRIDTVFHAENLVLREIVDKMVVKMSKQYQENRAEVIKARLRLEKSQDESLPPLRPRTRNTDDSQLNGTRELGTRRIQRWTGLNGATMWRTPLNPRSRRSARGYGRESDYEEYEDGYEDDYDAEDEDRGWIAYDPEDTDDFSIDDTSDSDAILDDDPDEDEDAEPEEYEENGDDEDDDEDEDDDDEEMDASMFMLFANSERRVDNDDNHSSHHDDNEEDDEDEEEDDDDDDDNDEDFRINAYRSAELSGTDESEDEDEDDDDNDDDVHDVGMDWQDIISMQAEDSDGELYFHWPPGRRLPSRARRNSGSHFSGFSGSQRFLPHLPTNYRSDSD